MGFSVKYIIFVLFYGVIQSVPLQASLREIVQHLEREPENKAMIEKLTAEIVLKQQYDEPYGGEPGKAYFNYFNNAILNPALASYLAKLKAQKVDSEEQINLFASLIDELGKIRHDMAAVSTVSSEDSLGGLFNRFGLRVRNGATRIEPINSFPAWRSYWHHRLAKLIDKKADGEIVSCHELINKLSRITDSEQFEIEIINDHLAIMGPLKANASLGSLQISCDKIGDTPDLKLTLAPADDALFNEVAKKFFAVLNLPRDVTPEMLLQKMASFFLFYSHEAIFIRGQASIGEALLKALANAQGYSISYAKQWMGPHYPSADMHALSTFNEERFIKDFVQNVKLKSNREIAGFFRPTILSVTKY